MNLPLFIAKRYILGKKSHNAINIVSIISMCGVVIGTMAFILILSVFNGFDKLVKNMYNSFYPDLKVMPVEGKVFSISDDTLDLAKGIKGISEIAEILEDNAMLMYRDKPTHSTIRGVSSNYPEINNIDSGLWDGEYLEYFQTLPMALVGRGVFYQLGMVKTNEIKHVKVIVPKRNAKFSNNPQRSLTRRIIGVSGVFASQPDIDGKYTIVPLDFAQDLFNYPKQLSSLEIKLDVNYPTHKVVGELEKLLGNGFDIKDRYQQNELLYKTMQTEKWAIFLILALVLIILLFSLVGSLSMLIIEKKKDIQILSCLGAGSGLIRKIFFREGILITFTGAAIGLLLGSLLAWIQEQFGIIRLKGGFVIDAYPVDIQGFDFIIVSLTVMVIGAIASYYPLRFLLKKNLDEFRFGQ